MKLDAAKAKDGKKVNKKKVSITVTLISLVLIVYFVVSLVGLMSDIGKSKDTYSSLEAKLAALQAENEELQNLIDSDSYIERIAREKYNYVSPGEEVYADLSGN